MIARPRKDPLRVAWNEALGGWYVEVPVILTRNMLRAVGQYAAKIQEDRWRGMRPGDERDRLGRALNDLRAGRIRQVIRKAEIPAGTFLRRSQ